MNKENIKGKSKFDLIENNLLSNPLFLSFLNNFKYENQVKMKQEEKVSLLLEIDTLVSKTLQSNKLEAEVIDNANRIVEITDNKIYFSKEALNDGTNLFLFLEEYFYDLRLIEQERVIFNGNKDGSMDDELYLKLFKNYSRKIGETLENNIISSDDNLFYHQPIFIDATKYSKEIIFNIAKKMINTYGSDKEVELFLINSRVDHVTNFEEKNEKALKIIENEYKEIQKQKQAIEIFKKNNNIPVTKMDDEILYCFMSPAFKDYLSDRNKKLILKEFLSRELNKYGLIKNEEPIEIEKDFFIFETALDDIFMGLIDNIQYINHDFGNKDLVKEIEIGKYMDEKKCLINPITEGKIEFFIHPLNRFAEKFIEKHVNLLCDAMEKNFPGLGLSVLFKGKYSAIDSEKLQEVVEKYYEIPFVDVCKMILNKMENNVVQSKNKNSQKNVKRMTR